jgi:hypothetical protein
MVGISVSKNPLWPAGHLPHKGGEDSRPASAKLGDCGCGRLSPSPLWGGVWGGVFLQYAMAGRAEGVLPRTAASRRSSP